MDAYYQWRTNRRLQFRMNVCSGPRHIRHVMTLVSQQPLHEQTTVALKPLMTEESTDTSATKTGLYLSLKLILRMLFSFSFKCSPSLYECFHFYRTNSQENAIQHSRLITNNNKQLSVFWGYCMHILFVYVWTVEYLETDWTQLSSNVVILRVRVSLLRFPIFAIQTLA